MATSKDSANLQTVQFGLVRFLMACGACKERRLHKCSSEMMTLVTQYWRCQLMQAGACGLAPKLDSVGSNPRMCASFNPLRRRSTKRRLASLQKETFFW